MFSVSDILKILESIPTWKQLKSLPDKVTALEKRLSELETKIATPPPETCPKCGSANFKVIRSRGINQRTHYCPDCEYKEVRQMKPK